MKNKIFKTSSWLAGFLLLLVSVSCCNEEIAMPEPEGHHTCRLLWNDEGISGFGAGSRSALRENKDGDCVYILFEVGSKTVNGTATYSAANREWTLSYYGSLGDEAGSPCSVCFFEGINATHTTVIPLSSQTLVSRDANAEYTKTPDYVRLKAHLTPITACIRFKGNEGQAFSFSGIKYPRSYDVKTGTFTMAQDPLTLTIASDGYTPAVYALPDENRILKINYDFQSYTTACESPILDTGMAGYMLLPAETAHNGWELIKVELPQLSAVTAGNVSDKAALIEAKVSSLGNGTLVEAGFVYALDESPTLEYNLQKISCGTALSLSAQISGLTPLSTYYVRAYATNERGTAYSEPFTLTTLAEPTVPSVSTGKVSELQPYSAVVEGTISVLGAPDGVTQHGHVWSTSPNPTTFGDKTWLGAKQSTGHFSSSLSALQPNTTYYVRAYATNSLGTVYGEETIFATPSAPVLLNTGEATAITSKQATLSAQITDTGGHTVSERGLCWSEQTEPTIAHYFQASTTSNNSFELTLTDLQVQTLYYVRAYAKTADGSIFYGNTISFSTTPKEIDIEIGEYDKDDFWEKQ